MKLSDLKPNEGATHPRKRKGIGMSAGQGKTSGRGTKGQNSRTGAGGHLYRQGGNLPFFRRLPFQRGEGFTPPNRTEFNEVNLDQLSSFAAGSEVTPQALAAVNLLSKPSLPVVLLGNGELKISLKVKVHRVSKGARAKIEKAGGSVELIA